MAARSSTVFVGLKGTVAAIDRDTGATKWTSDLAGSDFVNVSLHNPRRDRRRPAPDAAASAS
jgi:outer membrane protein assembly factor BamB